MGPHIFNSAPVINLVGALLPASGVTQATRCFCAEPKDRSPGALVENRVHAVSKVQDGDSVTAKTKKCAGVL